MSGLTTIVKRELIWMARHRVLHRLRLGAGLLAVLVGFTLLLVHATRAGATNPGRDVFTGMVLLAFVFNLAAGPLFGVDTISAERREGTLGLLMLTPLRGYEVVMGKFVSHWFPGIQTMLAMLPVFGLATFMGGVSAAEFGRAFLVLGMSLIVSLALSMGVSCLVCRSESGLALNIALLLVILVGIPILRYDDTARALKAGSITRLSPCHALTLVDDTHYAADPSEFWMTLGSLGALASGALGVGGLVIERSWRTRTLPQHRSRSRRGRIPARSRLYEAHPFLRLAAHTHVPVRKTWWLVFGLVAGWCLCGAFLKEDLFNYSLLFGVIYLSNLTLKLWVAWLSTHRLAEDRRSGALEMLCCLPVSERSIWGAWLLHLKLKLFAPFACLILAESFLLAIAPHFNWTRPTESPQAWLVFLILTVGLVGDSYVLCWSGLRFSLGRSRRSRALAKTIGWVLLPAGIIPVLALGAWDPFMRVDELLMFAMLWAALSLMTNIPACAMAMAFLSHSFRESLSQSSSPSWDSREARRALSVAGRRGGVPTLHDRNGTVPSDAPGPSTKQL